MNFARRNIILVFVLTRNRDIRGLYPTQMNDYRAMDKPVIGVKPIVATNLARIAAGACRQETGTINAHKERARSFVRNNNLARLSINLR